MNTKRALRAFFGKGLSVTVSVDQPGNVVTNMFLAQGKLPPKATSFQAAKKRKKKRGATLIGRGTAKVVKAGAVKVTVRATRAAKRLRRKRSLKVALLTTLTNTAKQSTTLPPKKVKLRADGPASGTAWRAESARSNSADVRIGLRRTGGGTTAAGTSAPLAIRSVWASTSAQRPTPADRTGPLGTDRSEPGRRTGPRARAQLRSAQLTRPRDLRWISTRRSGQRNTDAGAHAGPRRRREARTDPGRLGCGRARSPAGFNVPGSAGDPSAFALTDAAVRDAVAQGLHPVLVVASAPRSAEAQARWPFAFPGSWAPEPLALRAFAGTLARRYSGATPDPAKAGRTLPRVRYFQAWNEPNLPRYLEPQWIGQGGRWLPFAPQHYRAMLNSFFAAVKAVHPDNVVVAAGLAPLGEGSDGLGRMTPMRFLNELLCLGPPPDSTPRGCPDPPHFDVLAFHPLSVDNPDLAAPSALDVSIADIAKLKAALRAAARAGILGSGGSKPLWVTELNWQSKPPSPDGVPARRQAHWIARAMHRLWAAGVKVVTWHSWSTGR